MNTAINIQRLALVALMATTLGTAQAHRRPMRRLAKPVVVAPAKPITPKKATAHFGQRQRLDMALAYIDRNRHITAKAYSKLTGLQRKAAEQELDAMARSPRSGIALVMSGNKKLYVRA